MMKRKGFWIAILIIAVIGVSVYAGFTQSSLNETRSELNATQQELNETITQVSALEDQRADLIAELNFSKSAQEVKTIIINGTFEWDVPAKDTVEYTGTVEEAISLFSLSSSIRDEVFELINSSGGKEKNIDNGGTLKEMVYGNPLTVLQGEIKISWMGYATEYQCKVNGTTYYIYQFKNSSVWGWSIERLPEFSPGGPSRPSPSPPSPPSPPKICKVYGLNFGPYVKEGQNPDNGTYMPEEQIRELMTIIAPYTQWVRTFGCTNGLEKAGPIAYEQGLKIAVGAWLGSNLPANEEEVANLIKIGQDGEADILIVGSEVLLRGDLTEAQLIDYINRVRTAVPPGIPVATADTYGELLSHPDVMAAGDVVLANFYHFWEGIDVNQSRAHLNACYQTLVAEAGGKKVYVSETGWPSEGEPNGSAVPSPENAAFYFQNFVSWAEAQGVDYFYFEAFDEPWKVIKEGSRGAHWGVWDKDGNLKLGMAEVFNCTRMNNPPVANAGPDKVVNELESVILNGSGSYDPDGDSITFSWSCGGGILSDPSIAQPTFTAPEVSANTTFTCTLTVSDGKLSDTDTVSILVKDIPVEPGDPAIWFTYVPPYGSFNNLQGQVGNVTPADYKVAVYIKVGGFWWTKPYWTSPLTVIKSNGSWTCDITTGGNDETATEIAAYLVPNGYNPPLMGCEPTPPMTCSSTLPAELEANSVAKVGVTRSH